MRIVREAVQNGVGVCGIANDLMPSPRASAMSSHSFGQR